MNNENGWDLQSMGLNTFDDSDRWHQQQRDRGSVEQLAYKPKKKKPDGDDIIEQLANQYYADAMAGASAIGQQMGQSFNRRGLGGSPLAAGIQSQAMNQALGRAQAEVAKMRLGYMTQQDAIKRQEQMQSDQMLYQMLSAIIGAGGRALGNEGVMDWLKSMFGDGAGSGSDAVSLDYDPVQAVAPSWADRRMSDYQSGVLGEGGDQWL
jgi:hypothetical protein